MAPDEKEKPVSRPHALEDAEGEILMPKYKIRWNAGFGAVEHIIDVATIGEALQEAEDMAIDQFRSNATWHAELVREEREVSHETSSVGGLERP